jgi:hypothetical protein
MTLLQDFKLRTLTSRYNFMTTPHTELPSELIITDYNNKVKYVLVIFDHSLVSE